MELTYGSGCSGIEAASVAWEVLGWKAAWFAEIDPFPSAVLAHHYPAVPNLGDMTRIGDQIRIGDEPAPDIWVAGTPCQAFSVAGARAGLSDSRGQLTLEYVRIANEIDLARRDNDEPECICVWENVPGVLSSRDNAFGCFLGALAGEDCELQPPGKRWPDAGCVYGPQRAIAWRILDAQYFGLAQRRRRVFVVASARPGFHPAQVLFEREGLRRDSPPSRSSPESVAGTLSASTGGADENDARDGRLIAFGGNNTSGPIDVAPARNACGSPSGRLDFESEAFVVHGTQDPVISQELAHALGRNHGQENAVLAFTCKDHGADVGHISPTLRAMGHGVSHANAGGQVAVAYPLLEVGKRTGASTTDLRAGIRIGGPSDPMFTLQAGAQHGVCMTGVRRLTPRECERLQGFPDDYTLIPWRGRPARECPDGPRYKAIGNSKAVTVVRWIGRRIEAALQNPWDNDL